jgi:acyl carrier protein
MMADEMRDLVIAALNKATGVLNTPEFARAVLAGQDLEFDSFDMDSLTLFEVVMSLEDRLGIELDADEVLATSSVDGLVAFLQTRAVVAG